MKQNRLLIAAITLFVGCQSAPEYTLDAEVQNFYGKVILITPDTLGNMDTIAQGMVEKGRVQLRGKVSAPTFAFLQCHGEQIKIPLIIENTAINIKFDFDHPTEYAITGGPIQELRNAYQEEEVKLQQLRDSLHREYRQYAEEKNLGGVMHIRALIQDLDSASDSVENHFLATNNNVAAAGLLYMKLNTFSRRRILSQKYELLGDTAAQSVVGKIAGKKNQEVKNIAIGGLAPDFTMSTPEGKAISLYGIKARVKIIDFWASWCGPCRAENPNIRRLYEKYKDSGLEIISVSLDSKKEPWVKAIEKDDLPWIHVSDLLGWENTAAKQYGVKGIPHVFVLDENNRILGEKLYGKKLEACITKIIGK